MSEDEFDPVRAKALEQAFEELPRRSGVRHGVAQRGLRPHRDVVVRRVATAFVAITVLIAAVAVLQVAQRRSSTGGSKALPGPVSTPAPTITAGGAALRYAGVVPWRNAVRATEDSRELTIAGDGDAVHGREFVCGGTDAQRVQVHETATSIEILVLGYAAPKEFEAGDCIGVGHATTAHTVHLKAPVGARAIVDMSNRTKHSVLTDADVPKAGYVPAGYVDLGATWDDRFPGVTRTYASRPATGSGTEHFTLEIGFDGIFDALDHPYWTKGPTTAVRGAAATVWRHSDMYNVNTLIEWHRGSLIYRLTTFGTPTQHLTEQQAVAIARSVAPDTHRLPAITPSLSAR
ncbi:hypothetical protein [uncultured Amnibacterium sp.]|uniref:hypothetical protein n=1 Tax=uncultured Amnibacterium sp. TaxID=1631851 RepID=UPI0035CB576D